MKFGFKKFLSMVLVTLLVISLFPTPSIIVAEGSDGTAVVANESTNAAKIGDTEYANLADAVKAVEKGKTATPTTITLLKDQKISSLMVGHQYTQNIIIDLSGYTLSSSSIALTAYRSGTTLTVQNGTVLGNSTSGTLRATYGGKLVLGENLTVKGAGGSANLVYVDNGSAEVAAPNGVEFVGGKLEFKLSDHTNNTVIADAAIGRTYFGTLEAAIAAAEAGDTVTMMNNVAFTEILAIAKAITLDGNGHTLTSTAARAINVSDEIVTIKKLTIHCSGERAINLIQNAKEVTIDTVTATASNYTVNIAASAPNAVVKIINSTLDGLCTVNVAAAGAKVAIENSTINCNDNNTTVGESYAALTLNKDATNATITTVGCTINVAKDSDSDFARNSAIGGEINIDDPDVEVKTTVAVITYPNSNYYHGFYTLASAIEFAKDGDTITLIRDINLTAADFGAKHDGYNTFFNISGKSITIDLNGNTIKADVSETTLDAFILGVFCTTNEGHLTLKDSSNGKGGVTGISGSTQEQAYLDASKGNTDYNYKFYSLLVNYDNSSSIIIDGGNYTIDYAGDSLAYTSGNEGIVVNGGTFKVGNLGGIRNGMPWVFNAKGRNERHVVVNGGTFCADVFHQYYVFEVQVPDAMQGTLALQYNAESNTYTVVPAVAYVAENHGNYTMNVGYATLADALAACNVENGKVAYRADTYFSSRKSTGETIVLLKDITLPENTTIVIDGTITINLNGKTIYGENTRTNTHNFLFDVKGGTLTALNGTIAMKHTGDNMGWNGATTVIDVTAGGVLNLNGVTVQNQGGTDMNFAVHLNNWGEVTLNADNCVFDAPYCGVRVFNSGYDMNNVKITNSKLTGATRAFWVHNYLGDLDSSKHSDEAIKARLNLDIYGNNNTFEITGTAKTPIRYGFGNTVYFNAEGSQVVDSAEELQDAINNGSGDITLGGDIDLSNGIVIP